MRKRKYIINLVAAAALLVGCSESLEDTYSDYAGDGKIRYVAKCTEVHATPGWERLVLEFYMTDTLSQAKLSQVKEISGILTSSA